MIATWWSEAGISILLLLGWGVYTLSIWGISAAWKNHTWRQTIADHLGEITKAEIGKRDDKIAETSFALDTERKNAEQLRVKVKAMAALSGKQIDIAGNTCREDRRETGNK